MKIVKRAGTYLSSEFIGQKLIVTKTQFSGYKVGDIYLVSANGHSDPRLLIETKGEWVRLNWSGYDAELALYEEDQLTFNFSSNQNSLETLDW